MLAARAAVSRRPMVLLPQPDSPTSPTVSPAATSNVTSSTARTVPLALQPRDLTLKCFGQALNGKDGDRRRLGKRRRRCRP